MNAVIYHNPACGTSRKTLEILEATPGIALNVIDYMKTPPTRERLVELYARAGISPRDGMRIKGTSAEALGLTDPLTSADEILDAMIAHPILINRPLVETDKGVRLCRPQDVVREIL